MKSIVIRRDRETSLRSVIVSQNIDKKLTNYRIPTKKIGEEGPSTTKVDQSSLSSRDQTPERREKFRQYKPKVQKANISDSQLFIARRKLRATRRRIKGFQKKERKLLREIKELELKKHK